MQEILGSIPAFATNFKMKIKYVNNDKNLKAAVQSRSESLCGLYLSDIPQDNTQWPDQYNKERSYENV
jgi:hypothetical protein